MLEAKNNQTRINHITGDIHFISFLLKKNRTIITMHDCEVLMNKRFNVIKSYLYRMFWFTIPSMRVKHIVAISQETKKQLIKYANIKENKIKVIHDPVDDSFKELNLKEDKKNRILENPRKKKTVLHIANNQINKNSIRIAKAISKLDIKYIRVGKVNKKEGEILKNNKVDCLFLNNITTTKLVEIYNCVDCLVFASTIEGFGLPIIEGQKCGCPVITSNCSSMPEIASQGAHYVNPYSENDIRKGIIKVLNDKEYCKTLTIKGKINSKKYESKVIAQKYERLYKSMIKSSK